MYSGASRDHALANLPDRARLTLGNSGTDMIYPHSDGSYTINRGGTYPYNYGTTEVYPRHLGTLPTRPCDETATTGAGARIAGGTAWALWEIGSRLPPPRLSSLP
jgi:hypothetical protein